VLSVAVGAGTTVGAALSTDRRVGKLSFIGSVPVGRTVAQAAAGAGIPVVLELGGKSANIVFADADLDQAARGAVSAVFSGAGQSCVAGSRLLVERSVHDELVARIVAHVEALRLGDPLDPLRSERQHRRGRPPRLALEDRADRQRGRPGRGPDRRRTHGAPSSRRSPGPHRRRITKGTHRMFPPCDGAGGRLGG